ncbi:MAG: LLM class F420-dependent oxidoreductase [Alphaproteobacteria bacterium]
MRLGIALPHFGPYATPQAIVAVARKAEALGFASLWVLDRLLWPIEPVSKYPGNSRGEMPSPMQNTYDPFVVLSFAAAHTQKLSLGTSVLVAAYRSPAVTAKMAATLDLLSNGRVILGLGVGWSADEFAAVGRSLEERNQQADEFIEVLRELWKTGESFFEGKFYRIPRSLFLPKPLQSSGPPIWIGGNSERALRRVATHGDGWHPTSRMPIVEMTEKITRVRDAASKRGRKAEDIALTLRWNAFPDLAVPANRSAVAQKLRDYRAAGVEHICIDFNIPQPTSMNAIDENMERLMREIVPAL